MTYKTEAVANQFLLLAEKDGIPMTHMKLQKLLYYAYGWYFAFWDKPLFNDKVEAWQFGPVVHSVYKKLKRYGNRNIVCRIGEESGSCEEVAMLPPADEEVRDFLESVWDAYKGLDAIQLMNSTHDDGTPWKQVHDQYGGIKTYHEEIPDYMIKDYFLKLADDRIASRQ